MDVFLLRIDDRLILIDTGAGQQFGPDFGGKLVASLASVGVTPNQITDIFLTHLHPDHMGGLVHDGQVVFPNATVRVGKPDLDFFLDRSNVEKAHYDAKYFDAAAKTIQLYVAAGKVQGFSGTAELAPALPEQCTQGTRQGARSTRWRAMVGQSFSLVISCMPRRCSFHNRPSPSFTT